MSIELNKELSDDIVMIMGGAYELIYRYISKGESLYVPHLLKKIMVSFTNHQSHTREMLSKTKTIDYKCKKCKFPRIFVYNTGNLLDYIPPIYPLIHIKR